MSLNDGVPVRRDDDLVLVLMWPLVVVEREHHRNVLWLTGSFFWTQLLTIDGWVRYAAPFMILLCAIVFLFAPDIRRIHVTIR